VGPGAILHPWVSPAPDPNNVGFGRGFYSAHASEPDTRSSLQILAQSGQQPSPTASSQPTPSAVQAPHLGTLAPISFGSMQRPCTATDSSQLPFLASQSHAPILLRIRAPDGFGSEISPVGVGAGVISHPNQFCHGSDFCSTRPIAIPI
jgi:hypothetical protein